MHNQISTDQFKFWMNAAKIDIGLWATKTFPNAVPQSIVRHIEDEVEELDEITRLAIKDESKLSEIPGEMADIILLLFHLAYIKDIDLGQAIVDKFEINKKRKWNTEPNEEGCYKHIEEES